MQGARHLLSRPGHAVRWRLYPLSLYELHMLGGLCNCDDNVVINDGDSPGVDGAEGYAAATTVIEKLDGSAPIQTAETIDLGTQTAPVVQMLGSGRWESRPTRRVRPTNTLAMDLNGN